MMRHVNKPDLTWLDLHCSE